MTPVDLRGQTEPGYHWSCSTCRFITRSLAAATQHCEEASGDYPAHEHTLHELASDQDTIRRNRARRVIACRNEDGVALNARIYLGHDRRHRKVAA